MSDDEIDDRENDNERDRPRRFEEKEYRLKCGATSFFVRRHRDGEWSLVFTRKLFGLFRRPDETYSLRKFPSAVFVCWVEDGEEFREVYLVNRKGKREFITQMDEVEMEWFEDNLGKTGIRLEYE